MRFNLDYTKAEARWSLRRTANNFTKQRTPNLNRESLASL